ncbi:MAG TPA: MFS transporter [Caulobacteraceae bacterium]
MSGIAADEVAAKPVIDARRVALIVAAAFFMQNLDGAIINTSLPQMARTFAVRPADLNIGITAYILSTAAFVPLSGWIADRLGAKRVFAGAIVVFTLASLACGFSQDLWQFTAARAVQGLGGALMTPVGRMVVLRNAAKTELLAATALITWPALIAPVVGPVLGGFITTYINWRWNFLLNGPLGIAGVLLVLAFIPNTRDEARSRFDVPGFLLTASSLIALLAGFQGLVQGHTWVWPILAVAAGLALGAISILHLNRAEAPLLELSSFKAHTFAVTTIGAGNLFRITIAATPFLLPLMFQLAFGLSAWLAGLYVLAYFGGNLLMKTVTTPALRNFGFRNVLFANGLLAGASMIACAFLTPATSAAIVVVVLLIAGLTRSMQFTALATLAFADIEAHQRASSSTLSSMVQQVGAGVGVGVAAILINLSQAWRGAPHLALADFRFAFLVVGGVAVASSLLFLRLAPDAGAEVSGHGRRRAA